MSSSLVTGGVLGGPLGLVTDGLLGPLLSEESPTTPAEAPIGTCTWLLDLDIGGRVLRYATRSVTVYDAQGRAYLYRGGLADFELMRDGFEQQLAFRVSDRRVSWPQLAAQGEAVERATATLRHWEPGELLEGALVVLLGDVTNPEYADPNNPASFVGTIRAGTEVDRTWPSEQAAVTTSTWDRDDSADTYDEQVEGAVYQTVFGYPGEGDIIGDRPTPCLPGLLVRWNNGATQDGYLMLGQGVLDCVGGQVYVRDVSSASGGDTWEQEWLDVETRTDKQGQIVTVAVIPIGSGVQSELGHEYYVGFSRDTGKGGGSPIPGRSRPMETLADVAAFCLRGSGRRVDLEAQESQRLHLDRYRIDGYINDEVQLVPWFEAHMLPLFPVVRAQTVRGMYWRFVNWWARPTDAVAHLDADAGQVTRSSSIRTPADQVYNHFRIDFQLGHIRLGARRTLTAQAQRPLPWYAHSDGLADDRIIGSPVCARSQSIYGIREAEPVETPFIWSESTAVAILEHLAVRDAFPRRPVTYTGPASQLRRLQRGDVVTVTDSSAALNRAVAMVSAVILSSRRLVTVELELLDPRRIG